MKHDILERTTDAAPGFPEKNKRTLLVVDSDAANLKYTTGLLTRFSYYVRPARTAKEATEAALVTVPSLIVTTLDLKDSHGLDFIQDLRKHPGIADVPFIVLRRQGDLVGEKRSLEMGAKDCLYHPVAPEKLYVAVQTATEIRPRQNIRLKTTLPVTVDGTSEDGLTTLDLSERGMFLHAREPVPPNTQLSLRFNIQNETIPVEARVVYSYKTPGGPHLQPGMGLEFVRITPRSQELIRRFVKAEITRGITPTSA